MSTRRSRIKPAINLAASRRPAGSKPVDPATSVRLNRRSTAKRAVKNVPTKTPDEAPPTEATHGVVPDRGNDHAAPGVVPDRGNDHAAPGVVETAPKPERQAGHSTPVCVEAHAGPKKQVGLFPTKPGQTNHIAPGLVEASTEPGQSGLTAAASVDAPTKLGQSGHTAPGLVEVPTKPGQSGNTAPASVDAPTKPGQSGHMATIGVDEAPTMPGQSGNTAPASVEAPTKAGQSGQTVSGVVDEAPAKSEGCEEMVGQGLGGEHQKSPREIHGAKETRGHTIPGEEHLQKAKSPVADMKGPSKNSVRRKRISAAPNISKRRLPGTGGKIWPPKTRRTDSKGGTQTACSKVAPSLADLPTKDGTNADYPSEDNPKADHHPLVYDSDADQTEMGQPVVVDHSRNTLQVGGVDIPDGPRECSQSISDANTKNPDKYTGGGTVICIPANEGDTIDNSVEAEGSHIEPPSVQRKLLSQPLKKFDGAAESSSAPSHKDTNRHTSVHGANNIYKKKLDEMKTMKKDEAASRRRKMYAQHSHDGINTSMMLMRDLIYFNPKENRMSSKSSSPAEGRSVTTRQPIPRSDDEEEDSESEEPAVSAAPQVTIGPDGNIVLDKQSLVKVVTPKRKLDESEITEVKEDSSTTTYSSFRKPTYSSRWSEAETTRFYRALSAVGTDFSMINAIFPNRKRRELKNKFKREERKNAQRMERTLNDVRTFDFCDFQNMDGNDNAEEIDSLKCDGKTVKKRERKKKKKQQHEDPEGPYIAPRSRDQPPSSNETTPQMGGAADKQSISDGGLASTSSEALQNLKDPFGSSARVLEEGGSSDEEENYHMEEILGKPTRSGRQPKQREVFTIQDSLSQPRLVRPVDHSGGGKRKTRKQRAKGNSKRAKSGDTDTGPTTSIESTPGASVDSALPELDRRKNTYNPLRGPQSANQPVASPTPAVRTEHYLITYPNGRQTLIQMPVPQESGKNFDFVFNVLPSPVREGSVLQLEMVPRRNEKDLSHSRMESSSAQSEEGTTAAPAIHVPSASASGSNVSIRNSDHGFSLKGSHVTPEQPPSSNARLDSQKTDSQSFLQDIHVEVPFTAEDNLTSSEHAPLNQSYAGSTSMQGTGHSSMTLDDPAPDHEQLSSGPQHEYGAASLDRGTVGTLPRDTLDHDMNRADSGSRKPSQTGRIRSSHRGNGSSSPYHWPRVSSLRYSSKGLSEQSLSAITDPPACLQKRSPELVPPCSGVITPITSLLDQPLTGGKHGVSSLSSLRMGNVLPPVSSLLTGPLSPGLGDSPSARILAAPGKTPPETKSRDEPSTTNICRDGEDTIGMTTSSSGCLGLDEVVYVSGLDNPIPATSRLESDPIVAQLVDVTSSAQQEDPALAENKEAFIPAV